MTLLGPQVHGAIFGWQTHDTTRAEPHSARRTDVGDGDQYHRFSPDQSHHAPGGWSCDRGFNCVYTSAMSWRSPTQGLPKETSPAAIFNRLFGSTTVNDAIRQARRRSVLDTVRDDAASLRANIGTTEG
ncbi:MAG: DUF1552 domain-containing protein [Planctomycetota bacterium]